MKNWIIPCAIILSAAAAAVLWPSGGEITMGSNGKPIVAQRQGEKVRMCWPEPGNKTLLTDAELIQGEKPAKPKINLTCTDWR